MLNEQHCSMIQKGLERYKTFQINIVELVPASFAGDASDSLLSLQITWERRLILPFPLNPFPAQSNIQTKPFTGFHIKFEHSLEGF